MRFRRQSKDVERQEETGLKLSLNTRLLSRQEALYSRAGLRLGYACLHCISHVAPGGFHT